ncbi:hypothetical protein JCM19992_02350 [Thermostilla marina]
MELPKRAKGDEYTAPGRYRELERSLARKAAKADIPTLYVYAFDKRTSVGPYVMVEKALIPGSPRAIGSALYAAGFHKTRVVMQQWNPRIRPSKAKIDGRPIELLLVSAMQIHSAPAYDLIRDAWSMGDDRPLIIAGGPKAIYEPWDFFGLSKDGSVGADLVCTGEEYVLIEALDRIMEERHEGEHIRDAFYRAKRNGLLDDIPGLVFRPDDPQGHPEYLVDTGIQRLVQDLDELPLPFDALGLFEPPHNRETLSPSPMPIEKIGDKAKILAMVTTHGCKFRCSYCPIPAYNQRTFRYRSPERLVEEFKGVAERTGISFFFGTDDNFFNSRQSVEEIFSAMAKGTVHGKPFRDAIRFGTEGTEFDVDKNRDLVPLGREGGLRYIWFGIEDMTAELIKKGQTPEKTASVFKMLLDNGIAPMPMMMHHDGQPLWSWKGLYGIINQVAFLFKQGAVTCQVTLLTPSVGSKGYEKPFEDGVVLKSAGGKPVEDWHYDGNHCVATSHEHPWQRQWNMLAAYAAFYNPVNLVRSLARFDSMWMPRLYCQVKGMIGLAKSIWNSRDWLYRLATGPIEFHEGPPMPKYPLQLVSGVAPEQKRVRIPVLSGT